jgi:hypothetical protein
MQKYNRGGIVHKSRLIWADRTFKYLNWAHPVGNKDAFLGRLSFRRILDVRYGGTQKTQERGKDFGFTVVSAKRSIYLECETTEARNRWVLALNIVLDEQKAAQTRKLKSSQHDFLTFAFSSRFVK